MVTGQQIVDTARKVLGFSYGWGQEDNPGFDCSGLTQWSYARNGIQIPRTSQAQATAGIQVAYNDLRPGDLVIVYPDASHVALYSGDGNVIQAATFGVPVEEVPIAQAGPFNQARRIIQEPSMTLYGVDVSNNNWNSAAACQRFIASLPGEGYSWVEAKVSEGNYYQDPYWGVTKSACESADMPVIGYHYVTTNDPASQARTFVNNGGGSVAMLDFEANSGNIQNFWGVVNAFNEAGVQITLSYIPQWYWGQIGRPDLTGVPGLIASSYFERGTYGSIEYQDAGGDNGPGWNPYGGVAPVIWQFSDAGVVNGMSVDVNAFKGTPDQLNTLLFGGPPVTGPNQPAIPKPSDEATQVSQEWDQDLLRWDFLGGRTQAEALGAIGAALKITGFTDPGAK